MRNHRTILDGLWFGEGPRWHEGSLWFSDMQGHRVVRTDLAGNASTVVELTHDDPSGIGWLPDGRLLVVAMDEPSDGGGPTELDGERAHAIRIGVVDLAASKILLRIRRLVDPSWISLAKKSEYANGLDSCGLAFDVHESLRLPHK